MMYRSLLLAVVGVMLYDTVSAAPASNHELQLLERLISRAIGSVDVSDLAGNPNEVSTPEKRNVYRVMTGPDHTVRVYPQFNTAEDGDCMDSGCFFTIELYDQQEHELEQRLVKRALNPAAAAIFGTDDGVVADGRTFAVRTCRTDEDENVLNNRCTCNLCVPGQSVDTSCPLKPGYNYAAGSTCREAEGTESTGADQDVDENQVTIYEDGTVSVVPAFTAADMECMDQSDCGVYFTVHVHDSEQRLWLLQEQPFAEGVSLSFAENEVVPAGQSYSVKTCRTEEDDPEAVIGNRCSCHICTQGSCQVLSGYNYAADPTCEPQS